LAWSYFRGMREEAGSLRAMVSGCMGFLRKAAVAERPPRGGASVAGARVSEDIAPSGVAARPSMEASIAPFTSRQNVSSLWCFSTYARAARPIALHRRGSLHRACIAPRSAADVADRNEEARDAFLDDVHLSAGARADDRLAHRHRFEDDIDPVVRIGRAQGHDDESGSGRRGGVAPATTYGRS